MKAKINPDNLTNVWFTYDGREPTEEDNDFGADFSFYATQENNVIAAVAKIVQLVNDA